jgi:two-component system nitrogen regulation response regulator NtrX
VSDLQAELPILIVDDEANIRRTLRMVLEGEGLDTLEAASAADAEKLLASTRVDLVILDVILGATGNGVDLLEKIRKGQLGAGSGAHVDSDVPALVISAQASAADGARAIQLGAFDFLAKPIDRDTLLVRVRNALERRAMTREVSRLRRAVAGKHEMLGSAPIMQDLFRQIAKVAPTKGRVLITGESGTGKELIARAIHDASPLTGAEFVKVNCAAIPPELIESELFGHEKGAFTGAAAKKRGLFEVAHGGTIFLDEIGDMALNAQAKVLRALQQGEIVRVGGEKVITVDVRVIAATNKDLGAEVAAGRFREDLFFRLNVIPIRSPSLRERLDDVPLLAESFVRQCCEENGFRPKLLTDEVTSRLRAYSWPGNVRELKNVIERLVIMSDDEITERDLPAYMGGSGPSARAFAPGQLAPQIGPDGHVLAAGSGTSLTPAPSSASTSGALAALESEARTALDPGRWLHLPLREFRDESEREFIRLKLREYEWNISRTAQALGIERTNLHKKLRALGIERGEE